MCYVLEFPFAFAPFYFTFLTKPKAYQCYVTYNVVFTALDLSDGGENFFPEDNTSSVLRLYDEIDEINPSRMAYYIREESAKRRANNK